VKTGQTFPGLDLASVGPFSVARGMEAVKPERSSLSLCAAIHE
jgi:hypothetical protein